MIAHQRRLLHDEIAEREGIPVTSLSRTLFDLAAVLPRRAVKHALNEAEVRGLSRSRSELEARFLGLISASGLPAPVLNTAIELSSGWVECDCVWRDRRLIVELDGHAFHSTTAAFERDSLRDRKLRAAGWTVVRVTWRQLHEDREALVADLRRILNDRSPPRRRDFNFLS